MYAPFNQLPASARVWIYQANRPFSEAEIAALQPALRQFAQEWTSHGRTLAASAEILHGQFLVIGLDEAIADASGCSIDASVGFVRGLEEDLDIQLLDKAKLAFLLDGQVQLLGRLSVRSAVAEGMVQPTTPYFDNTISTVGELRQRWPAPAHTTWLARYFAAAATPLT